MATEHGIIMVNIPQERNILKKAKKKKYNIKPVYHANVLLQVVTFEKLSDSNRHHVRICDILLCVGKYDAPYILFHQWDPEEQHFVDFLISESYEPLEPVWKFKVSPQPLINKLKESGYVKRMMEAAVTLCTGKPLGFINFLRYVKYFQDGCTSFTQKSQLQLVPHLPPIGIKLPTKSEICLPKGFKAHRPDSGEKCLTFPNDHQILFHDSERHKKGCQVILICMYFLITDPSGHFYFIILKDKPLHFAFYASCYYVTYDHDSDSLTVTRCHTGTCKGGHALTDRIRDAQSQLDRIFPKIIRQCGWSSLQALLTRTKLLR